MLTPKEIGGSLPVYGFDIPCSALFEAGYSSVGAVSDRATIAVCFKPTAVDTAYPLCDPTNHYLLLVTRTGAVVEVIKNGVLLGSYATSAISYAGLLSEAMTHFAGTDRGYYSNLHVVDGGVLPWGTFYEICDRVSGLWMCREFPTWAQFGRYVIGDRSAEITATATFASAEGTPDNLIDGVKSGVSWYPYDEQTGQYLQFVFTSPACVTEMTLYSSTANTRGSWKWQGSVNGFDGWTDLTEPFVMGGSAVWADASLSGNAGSYLGYRLVLTSAAGSVPGEYWYEMEFRTHSADDPAYGANGGRYGFLDAADLGSDTSGNGNHWAVTGVQSLDTPTNNHPVLNPLSHTAHALADGNLSFTGNAANNITPATMPCFDGCYWEVEWTLNSGAACGVAALADYVSGRPVASSCLAGDQGVYRFDGTLATAPLPVGNASIIGMAYRCGKLWYSVDGAWIGDPAADTGASDESIVGSVYPFWWDRWPSNVPEGRFRFSEADLAYPPPAGFRPLNAGNAPAPSVMDCSLFADIVIRTGTGTDDEISSLKFPPDWVNTKQRDSARCWLLKDRVRGDGKWISTDTADAEGFSASGAGSFTVDGYTTGNGDLTNISGGSFIDLCLRADPEAGFAVVTYEGDGVAGRQIPHGLGKAPAFMIVRRLDGAASDWAVYHKALGANRHLVLNKTDAAVVLTNSWNDTEPTTTDFTVGDGVCVNADGDRFVAYLFADSSVFRAFSYMGNGNADGPAADLGGRALSVPFLKNSGDVQSWSNQDAVRDPANKATARLMPDEAGAETSDGNVVLTSSGMKITSSGAALNGAGRLHVGLAVLAQPNKYSNAF